MMRNSLEPITSVTALVFCLLSSPAAFAQDTSGDIVVTAQRSEQRLTDVPMAVSVASGEQIERQGLNSMVEVTQRLTNVKLVAGSSSDVLQIRGIGSGNNAGFEQSVATFVDGVYRSRSRSIRSALFDIQRLEVLKGPQSTFFGNNAIAGALNIATRRPGKDFDFNGSALYSPSDGEYIINAGVDLPVSPTFGIRLAGQASGMDGYVHNDFLGQMEPHMRDWAGRVSLRWEPASSFSSNFRFDHARSRDRGAFPLEVANCPPPAAYPFAATSTCARYLRARPGTADTKLDWRSQSAETSYDNDMSEIAWINELDISGVTLTATTGWFKHAPLLYQQVQPFPLSASEQTATPVNAELLGPASIKERYNSFSQELRAAKSFGALDLTVGAYFAKSQLFMQNNVGTYWATDFAGRTNGVVPAGTPITHRITVDQDDKTWSFFAAGTLHLGERWKLNGGLRYSRVSKEAHRTFTIGTSGRNVFTTFSPLTDAQQAAVRALVGGNTLDFPNPNRVDKRLMPSASLQFDVTSNVVAYASYSTGFKAGGYGIAPTPQDFGPERVKSFELGLKGKVTPELFVSSALFLSKFSDLQVSSPVQLPNGTTTTTINNAAAAQSKGAELEVVFEPTSWLTLRGNIAYLEATYKDYPSATCTILQSIARPQNCIQDLSGQVRAYAPKWNGSFGLTARVPVGNDYEIRVDPSMYFSSSFYQQDTIDPLFVQNGYAKVDFRVGYGPADGRWEVAVVGKNLTNKLTTGYKATIGTSPGVINTTPDRPRSIALQLTIR